MGRFLRVCNAGYRALNKMQQKFFFFLDIAFPLTKAFSGHCIFFSSKCSSTSNDMQWVFMESVVTGYLKILEIIYSSNTNRNHKILILMMKRPPTKTYNQYRYGCLDECVLVYYTCHLIRSKTHTHESSFSFYCIFPLSQSSP